MSFIPTDPTTDDQQVQNTITPPQDQAPIPAPAASVPSGQNSQPQSQPQPQAVSNAPQANAQPQQDNSNHPMVKHASIIRSIAESLAGGPRYKTVIDDTTGETRRVPVPLDRKDIGMAIAMSAIEGGLAGLQAKGPNASAQAAGLGFGAVAQRREQADKDQDAQAAADFARKMSFMENNMHLAQQTAALGHDNEDALNKYVAAFDDVRDEQGTPAIANVSESDLHTKFGGQAGKLGEAFSKYLAVPSKVVPVLNANGQPTGQNQLLWNLYDQTSQMPLSQEFLNRAAQYGVPGSVKSDGTPYQLPENASVSAPAYVKMIRHMQSVDLLQNDVNEVAETTKTQPIDVKALVRSGKLSPTAINNYFRDHGAAQNPAEAIKLMQADPKANAYAPDIVAAFGADAFEKYKNVQAQQAAANKKLGEESTPGGQATIAKTKADTVKALADANKAKESANPADVDILSDQLLQPNNLTAMKDIGGRGNQRTEILAAAARKAKERGIPFDIGLVNQRIKFLGEYEDPKGRAATNRQAINNILQHAGDLSDLNQQNRRADVRVVNTPINKLKDQFGDQTYTQYQTASGVLKDELSLYFAGGYAPSKEQQGMWDKIQSDTATPAQTEAFAKEVVRLGARRANTFNQQFKTNMGYDDPNMITPAAKAAAEHLGMGNEVAQFGSGGTLGQKQPQSQPTQRVVPAGAQPILRNGQSIGYILNGQRTDF